MSEDCRACGNGSATLCYDCIKIDQEHLLTKLREENKDLRVTITQLLHHLNIIQLAVKE